MAGSEVIGPAASGMCIVHEIDDESMRCGRYSGMTVDIDEQGPFYIGAEKHTDGVAELQASLTASMWALQSGLKAFKICYDATYAETVAVALASPKTNLDLAANAAALRRLLEATAEVVDSMHTPAHGDYPWNEFTDSICD